MGIVSLRGSTHQYLHEVASGLSAYADEQNLIRATQGRTRWGVVGLVLGAGLVIAGPVVSGEYTETLIWHQITFRGQPL